MSLKAEVWIGKATGACCSSCRCCAELELELGDCLRRVETLRARPGTVEDRVAPVQAHGVVESGLAFLLVFVSRVDNPAVGLKEDGGTQVLLRVPPVGGA